MSRKSSMTRKSTGSQTRVRFEEQPRDEPTVPLDNNETAQPPVDTPQESANDADTTDPADKSAYVS